MFLFLRVVISLLSYFSLTNGSPVFYRGDPAAKAEEVRADNEKYYENNGYTKEIRESLEDTTGGSSVIDLSPGEFPWEFRLDRLVKDFPPESEQ